MPVFFKNRKVKKLNLTKNKACPKWVPPVVRVNYLIAASAHRLEGATTPLKPEDVLKVHFQELLKCDFTHISQVTLLQALPLMRRIHSEEYWNIDDLAEKIPCKFEKLQLNGGAFSYGLWCEAVKNFRDQFDYYILIEDDYYPAHKDFAKILLDLHKEKLPNGGYLSSFVHQDHAAISNGITDSISFHKAMDKFNTFSKLLDYLNKAAQVNFSLMFDNIDDYADKYRSLFNVDCIECTHDIKLKHQIDIFNPVQYTALQKQSEKISFCPKKYPVKKQKQKRRINNA